MSKSKQAAKVSSLKRTANHQPSEGDASPPRPWWFLVLISLVMAVLIVAAIIAVQNHQPRRRTAIAAAAETSTPEIAALLREIDDVACSLVERYPDSPEALEVLARAHYRLSKTNAAEEIWEECLQLDPRFCPAVHAVGLLNMEIGNNTKAVEYFRRALELEPDNSSFPVELSQALMANGQTDEALQVLQADIARHPQSLATMSMLGQAYLQKRDYAQAKEYLERMIAIDPEFPNAYSGLVTACANLGEEELAKQYAETLKQLKTQEEEMHRSMLKVRDEVKTTSGVVTEIYAAAANVHLAHDEPALAEEYLLKAIQFSPHNVVTHEILAWLYQRQGRKEDAVRILHKLMTIAPNDIASQLECAQLCADLDMFDEAEAAYRHVIELSPKQAGPYVALAKLYLDHVYNLSEARKLAQAAVDLAPSAQHFYLLGATCQMNGDKDGARQAIARAAALDPQNPEYQRVLHQLGEAKQ